MEGTYIQISPNDILPGRTLVSDHNISIQGSTISAFYTCSAQIADSSSNYYVSIYDIDNATMSIDNQMLDVSFCKYSQGYTTTYYSSSKTMYDFYAQQCLMKGVNHFTLDGTTDIDSVLVLNYNKQLCKNRIKTNYQLNITNGTDSIQLRVSTSSLSIP